MSLTRRAILLGAGAALGSLSTAALIRGARPEPLAPLDFAEMMNDASELSPIQVVQHLRLPKAGEALQAELTKALSTGRPMVVSAARHSMGGHSLVEGGHVVTIEDRFVRIQERTAEDIAAGRLRYQVSGGTRWSDVIAALDPLGWSPAIMQSNNDFGVASTYSVNAHGWPVPYAGCGQSVRWVRMMDPTGAVRTLSRDQDSELFFAAMGGYGLFGAILEMELEAVPNQRLTPHFQPVTQETIGSQFVESLASDNSISMAYGRLRIDQENFFREGMLITYSPTEDQSALPPVTGSGFMSKAARPIFRAQVDNETAKELRWIFEARMAPVLAGETTRNTLINEPVITLDDRDPTRTDILHEYFLPPGRLDGWLGKARDIILGSYQQLLNITLRYLAPDRESMLAYAPEERIACVLLFSQEKSTRSEADMRRMTEGLIDAALDHGGSYYLPYRPHATREQLLRAYPRVREFVSLKRSHDPALRFQNSFWTNYLEDLA